MRYLALCCDYDGTIAHHGVVDEATIAGLERARQSGRRLLLVTGRELPDLKTVLPRLDLFDLVVAENGALLYTPATGEERALAEAPSPLLVQRLRERGVEPLSVGQCIVATWEPHDAAVLQVIHELGLELQIIFNKGAVMVLPAGVNKASGLAAALAALGLSPRNAVGIGDAENDHAFLALCECAVAVANALPALKEKADIVTLRDHGAGVVELIDELLGDDLERRSPQLRRRLVHFADTPDGRRLGVDPGRSTVLIAGTSGSGKSMVAKGLLERIVEQGYSFAVIDPEGDYEGMEGAVTLGSPERTIGIDEAAQLFKQRENAVLNLLGMRLQDRPAFFLELLARILAQRAQTGHPHWLFIDEVHHLFPAASQQSIQGVLPQRLPAAVMITVHPNLVAEGVLRWVDTLVVVGEEPGENLRQFAQATGRRLELAGVDEAAAIPRGKALVWLTAEGARPLSARPCATRGEHRRHTRKYAEGELPPDRCFYFRGPDDKLNLRAQNLFMFLQMADGVGNEVWEHHFRRGDVSRWIANGIKDDALAEEVRRIEALPDVNPERARSLLREAIERLYTLSA